MLPLKNMKLTHSIKILYSLLTRPFQYTVCKVQHAIQPSWILPCLLSPAVAKRDNNQRHTLIIKKKKNQIISFLAKFEDITIKQTSQ